MRIALLSVALALVPPGALAPGSSIGAEAEGGAGGTRGSLSMQQRSASTGADLSTRQQADPRTERYATREYDGWTEQLYRYGQVDPAPERLPMRGRAPEIGDADTGGRAR